MPSFDDETWTAAAPEEVWKALYDPMRFPEWWDGLATVTPGDAKGGDGDITLYPEGYPDFPMPQQLTTRTSQRQVIVSCMVSDLIFDWRLEPLDGDAGTRIAVHVEIPEQEAARLPAQREVVARSLRNLAIVATT
jgi:hypothetical protein